VLAAIVVGKEAHHGIKPDRHDIDEPVSIGERELEVDEVGTLVRMMEPPGTGEVVMEEDDAIELESTLEVSEVAVLCDKLVPEET